MKNNTAMASKPEKIKLFCEIAAYGCAALFLFAKLIAGQLNAGTDVSLELKRSPNSKNKAMDDLAVLVRLKRADIGRLELKDVLLQCSNPNDPGAKSNVIRNPAITTERKTSKGTVTEDHSDSGIFLPPNDATQLAFITQVKRDEPVLVDATILTTRTGPWIGMPQWRASAISFPDVSPAPEATQRAEGIKP